MNGNGKEWRHPNRKKAGLSKDEGAGEIRVPRSGPRRKDDKSAEEHFGLVSKFRTVIRLNRFGGAEVHPNE